MKIKSRNDIPPTPAIEGYRVGIVACEEKDGIIEIRRGVPDLNIGDRKFAQIRIHVNANDSYWYIKGMAIYADNLPGSYDAVRYIRPGQDPTTVMKRIKPGESKNEPVEIVSDPEVGKMMKEYFDPKKKEIREQAYKEMQRIRESCNLEVQEYLIDLLRNNIFMTRQITSYINQKKDADNSGFA